MSAASFTPGESPYRRDDYLYLLNDPEFKKLWDDIINGKIDEGYSEDIFTKMTDMEHPDCADVMERIDIGTNAFHLINDHVFNSAIFYITDEMAETVKKNFINNSKGSLLKNDEFLKLASSKQRYLVICIERLMKVKHDGCCIIKKIPNSNCSHEECVSLENINMCGSCFICYSCHDTTRLSSHPSNFDSRHCYDCSNRLITVPIL